MNIRSALSFSLSKSLYLSTRFHGRVVVARGAQIGDRVWLGTGATIVSATIGDGSVVGAGSVVSSQVPPKVLVKGNPASVVREDVLFEGHQFNRSGSPS